MAKFSIRRANKSDLNSWSGMRLILWPGNTLSNHMSELTGLLNEDSFQGWVALHGKKHIGFAEASIRPFANGCDSRPVVFLEGIWVDESHRNSGVGRAFIDVIENWARLNGISEIGSDSEFTNLSSHVCHKKWGFEETERVIYFRKRL